MAHNVAFERDQKGVVDIHCPKCHEKQELRTTPDWYEISFRGEVSPIFVCMGIPRSCRFEGHIVLINW